MINAFASIARPELFSMRAFVDAKSLASVHGCQSEPQRERVLGEVAKKSFIALPVKGGHSGLLP